MVTFVISCVFRLARLRPLLFGALPHPCDVYAYTTLLGGGGGVGGEGRGRRQKPNCKAGNSSLTSVLLGSSLSGVNS